MASRMNWDKAAKDDKLRRQNAADERKREQAERNGAIFLATHKERPWMTLALGRKVGGYLGSRGVQTGLIDSQAMLAECATVLFDLSPGKNLAEIAKTIDALPMAQRRARARRNLAAAKLIVGQEDRGKHRGAAKETNPATMLRQLIGTLLNLGRDDVVASVDGAYEWFHGKDAATFGGLVHPGISTKAAALDRIAAAATDAEWERYREECRAAGIEPAPRKFR